MTEVKNELVSSYVKILTVKSISESSTRRRRRLVGTNGIQVDFKL